jgi:DNA topoisomerase-1
MDVVIVESPAKAKTINKYLGPGYEVLASYGHVRDLPSKDGSVRPDDDFSMDWEVDAKSKKRLSDIADAVKRADRVILATDPDREGEAISWHVLQVLKDKKVLRDKPVSRVVFNAVTKQAVQEAMRQPRAIDEPLVEAYLARRALDYLVGFTLSPVLWRKLPGARSAGRVQSVALRLVCDREAEIEKFRAQEYWSVLATLRTPRNESFAARLVALDGKKLDRLAIGNGDDAGAAKRRLESSVFTVTSVEAKPQKRNPQPPFTTSTLQQEAQRKLGSDASRTMQIAQRLYEGVELGGETVGLITYMRTDGVDIAPRRSPRPASSSARNTAPATCRMRRAGIMPAPRTPRKRTRRFARPTCHGSRPTWRAISTATRRGSTSLSGSAPSPARWPRPKWSGPRSTSPPKAPRAKRRCAPPVR